MICRVQLVPGHYYADHLGLGYWYGGHVDGATGEPEVALWRLSPVYPHHPDGVPLFRFDGVLKPVPAPQNQAELANLARGGAR